MTAPDRSQPDQNGIPSYGYLPPQGQPGDFQQPQVQPNAWQQPQNFSAQYPAAQPTPPSHPNAQQPATYGYVVAAPPHTRPARPKRRRVVLVSTLVIVLVLTIGGAAALFVHLRGDNDDAGSGDWWSQAWLDGFEEAWTLEAPTGSGDQTVSKRYFDGRLVRIVSTSTTATITMYDVSGSSPKQLWETQQDVTETVTRATLWNRQVIVGDTLIDIDSQERSKAPWGSDARVNIASTGAIACVDTTCQCWSSPSEMLWEATFPTTDPMTVWGNAGPDGYSIATSSEYEDYFVVDLSTGSMNRLDRQKNDQMEALADGWLVYHSGGRRNPATVQLYEPDGTPGASFESDHQSDFREYPWSPTPFTQEQARAWLEDLDTSWAPATYTVSETDSGCASISVHGNDIALGEDNSLTKTDRSGKCTGTSPLQALYHSGQGQIQSFSKDKGDDRFLVLVDMTTGRSSEPIPLGRVRHYKGYTPLGDLLLLNYDSGELRAYRPIS